MSPFFQCIYGHSHEGDENEDGNEGSEIPRGGKEWRLPGLLYADDLALCGESEENLRAMVGQFVEVCRRRGLKVNAGKRKNMVLNREVGLDGEVYVGWIPLEHFSEFKYLICVLDESGTVGGECSKKASREEGCRCH